MTSRTVDSGISLLNFDDTLRKQPLLRRYPCEWIDFSDLRSCNGYCSVETLRQIQDRLRSRKHKRITLIGNGNFHYVTYALLSEIQQPFSLILFDHHTDLALTNDIPLISCGSWVSMALKNLPQLNRVIIIGAEPLFRQTSGIPYNVTIIPEQEIRRLTTEQIVRTIRSLLVDQPIYISVDKDVLDPDNAITNWDQGSMSLRQLLDVLNVLKRIHTLVGVDICGELPLSPVEFLSDQRVWYLKRNEIANKAIIDVLLAG